MAFASYVFDGLDDVLEFVWQSTAPDADRRKWTLSFWAKTTAHPLIDPEEGTPYAFSSQVTFFDEEEGRDYFALFSIFNAWGEWSSEFYVEIGPDGWEHFQDPNFDTKVWHHYVVAFDSTQANEAYRIKIYIDGQLVAPNDGGCELSALSLFFLKDALFELGRSSYYGWFYAGKLAFFQIVSGQALTPDAFGEERGGVWRHKPYEGSYGDWGLCLDGSQGFNDVSGNGFHFTNVGGVQLDPNDLPPLHEGFASYVFDGLDDALEFVWQSTAPDADRRKWTVSFWAKTTENVNVDPEERNPYVFGFQSMSFDGEDWFYFTDVYISDTWEGWSSEFYVEIGPDGWEFFPDPNLDTKVWHHYVVAFDSTQANEADRIKIYIDGQLVVPGEGDWECELNALSFFFVEDALFELGRSSAADWFFAGKLAFFQIVSGQALTPDAFGEERGGVWRHKPYEGSYGDWGLCLDGTDGFNDVSGNGFHFTNVGGVQLDPNDLPPLHEGFASYVFDGIDDAIQHVWSSTATDAERRVWTVSLWVKLNLSNNDWLYWGAINAAETEWTDSEIDSYGVYLDHNDEMGVYSEETPDNNVWTHYVFRVDTTLANAADRFRIYRNGSLLSPDEFEYPPRNTLTAMFQSGGSIAFFGAARLAFLDVVSGQSLGPDAFGFDNGGIWTRKPYKGSYGNFGFSLDGSQGFNDVSGNGFHFTQSGGVQLANDLPPHIRGGFSAIYLGETQINAIKLGSTDIKAVYLGSTKIFES